METFLMLSCSELAIAAVVMAAVIIAELAKISDAYNAKMREEE